MIGEYERAFDRNPYASIAPLPEHYGIQLWFPEAGGGSYPVVRRRGYAGSKERG